MIRKTRSQHMLGLLAGVSLTVLAAPASAQTASTPAPTQEASSVDDVVVTARRREERLQDVPVAATVVGEAQIRQYDLTSVANIRIVAPEITLDRGFTGSASSISLRGVSSSSIDAGVEQSVLLDFDGMAISRGRILNDALFDVESLSVLKGPQAVFFGKNSPGGVVSVRSTNPGDVFEGYVRVGYETTADNLQIETAAGGPINDQWGLRLALLSSSSEGYIRNQNAGVPDLLRSAASGSTYVPPAPERLGAEDKLAIRATLAYDNGEGFSANFKLLHSRYEGQGLNSFSEVMGCPGGRTQPQVTPTLLDPNGDCQLNDRVSQGWISPEILANWPQVNQHENGRPYSHNYSTMPVLTLNYDTDKFSITSVTGYYDYDYVSQSNADATSYSLFYSYSNEKNESFYQEVRATTSFDGPLNFAFGGHYEKNRRVLFVGAAGGALAMDVATGRYHSNDNEQHNRSSAWSAFGQVTYDITPELEFAAGLRYTDQTNEIDSFNVYVHPLIAASQLPVGTRITGEKSGDNVSPEATLTWRPNRNITLYGAYKTGFLAGGYSNPGALARTASLATLSFEEETVEGQEVGLKSQWFDGRLTANLTGFRYEYEGLPLTSAIFLNATTLTYITQNAANTVAQGVELETVFRPDEFWTFRGSASYNDAHFAKFDNAQCYTGQTVAQGCLADPVSGGRYQVLTGREVYRAPEWILTAGVLRHFDLTDNLSATANADMRYSSDYFSGLNLNPLSHQDAFVTLNAGLRVESTSGWAASIIGRNLTNERYATLGIDKPGGAGEVFAVAGEPRAIVFQLEKTF
ncbi:MULTISPECIES: TonB-dependent receptor [Brevundimonas]|uniref:TonB-dependent receptor n=1 Tax=Brevundimonas albigilva TaxID=1312364 RepID=A0ABY4SKE0_9CAUL|nr:MULTISPECIES: TonB-dependent receptor [Brevundimonas]URI14729.1 TonB-dependent receptor [Brevundimonas albigilva]